MRKMYTLLCAMLLAVQPVVGWAQQQVRIGRHVFVPEQNVGSAPRRGGYIAENQIVNNKYNALVQFRSLPTREQRWQLARSGVRLTSYLGGNAFFAELPKGFEPQRYRGLSSLMGIRGEWKYDHRLQRWDIPAHARAGADAAQVLLRHFGNVSTQWCVDWLRGRGFADVEPLPRLGIVCLTLPRARLAELAAEGWVASLQLIPLPEALYNASGAALGRANVLRLSGLLGGRGLTGRGVKVGVWDGNAERHFDYGSRLHQQEFEMDVASSEGHGMHVVGTVGGAGLLDPNAMGMAPAVNLYTYNFNTQSNGLSAQEEMWDAREEYGISLTQNSYGLYLSNLCDYYDMFSYSAQASSFNLDLLVNYMPELTHVFAAGNDQGACGITYGASMHRAKNVIYVGAVDELGAPSSFSSWGPMDDGRVVPTVSAKGVDVYSTLPGDSYGLMDGTSMATPAVTGQLALLTERYMQLNGGAKPLASLVRALAANTATDVNAPGPCYVYGYGILNSEAAVRAVERGLYRVGSFAHGDAPHSYSIDVPAGAKRLKVALAWSDTISIKEYSYGEPALVNDLDLLVEADGQSFMPWVLDADNPSLDPRRGRDSLNNLEQVTIDNPQGRIVVKVQSDGIPSAQQQYALTWWFEMEQLELSHPIGGEIFEPGERIVLRCSNGVRPYTAEVSYDGGATYRMLGRFSADEQPLTIPANAPATDRAMLRLIDQRGAIVTSAEFTIMARPQGLICSQMDGGAVLSWTPVPNAASYEVVRATPDGGGFEVVASSSVASFRLLPSHFVPNQRNAFSVRAIAANGTKGQRAVAQIVDAPKGTPLRIELPFTEEFFVKPSPYLREEHGSNMTVNYMQSPPSLGSTGAHMFVSLASATNNSYDFDTPTSYTLLGFDRLDLTGESGPVFMRVYGMLYDAGAPNKNQLRLEVDGAPLPMVDGRTVAQGDGEEAVWVWDLSAYAGQQVGVMLRHVSANTDGILLISSIMLLGEQPEPDVSVDYLSLGSSVASYGAQQQVEVMVHNHSSTAVAELPLAIEVDGELRGGMLIENLLPLELRTVKVQADLSTSEPLGGLMQVCARLSPAQDANPLNNADTVEVAHLGSVQPMPKGEVFDFMGMPLYVGGKVTVGVNDSLYVSDCEGPYLGYSGAKDDVMKLLPSNPNNTLQITFVWLQLGRSDRLEVFTEDVPASLYTSQRSPERTLSGTLSEPVGLVSHAADGGITLRHYAPNGSAGGKGWLALVREIPRLGNMLALSDMHVDVDLENAKATVSIKVDNLGGVPQHDVHLVLRQGLQTNGRITVAEEAIAHIAPGGQADYTFSYTPELAVPSFDSLEVRVMGYDGQAADNRRAIGVCADTYAPSPRLPKSKAANRIVEVSMYDKHLYGKVPVSDNQEFLTRDTLLLYAEASTNVLEVAVYARDTLALACWVDWFDEGQFVGQPDTLNVWADGTYRLRLEAPATAAPGPKRMRLMLADPAELVPHASGLAAIGKGDIKDMMVNVVSGNYPLLNDLAIDAVSSAQPSQNLGMETVSVTVSNNANTDAQGFTLTMSVDGGEAISERFDTLVPAFGGSVTVEMAHRADLSTPGRHEIEVQLPDDDDTDNNRRRYITSRVQPAAVQRDYYLHLGLDTLQEMLSLSDVGAARTGNHFGIDMWVRLDEPQTAPLVSCSDYLLMVLHGEDGLPSNALLVLYAGGGGQQMFATKPNTIMPGRWYHIAVSNMVWGPSEATVYINGVKQELLQNNAQANASFANMQALRAVRGSVDNLRFWNKELRQVDVKAYMFASARNAEGQLQGGCVAEFGMNEGPGNSAILSDTAHYALVRSQRTEAGEESVWQDYRQLFYDVRVEGAVAAERQGSQLLLTFPQGTDLDSVKCVVDKHFGAISSYNGQPFDSTLTLDLSQGEAVLLARLDMFGFSHRDTLRLLPQIDLSDEAAIAELTLTAEANPGLFADTTIAPVPQSLVLSLPAGVDVQRISAGFVLSSGASLLIDGQQQASPLSLDLSRPCVLTVVAENGRTQRIYTIAQGQPNSIDIVLPQTVQLAYGDTLTGLPTASSAGLPVAYSSSDNGVICSIGGRLVAKGVGRATVVASQPGNAIHAAAQPIQFNVEVLPRPATMQPQPITVEFGTVPPSLAFTYNGLVGGDTLSSRQPVVYRYMLDAVEHNPSVGLLPVGRYVLRTDAQPFVDGNYQLTPINGVFEVLASDARKVTFDVTDGVVPLPNAVVEVNGLTLLTDMAGQASTHLLPGRWSYAAALDGHIASSHEVEVADADVEVDVVLPAQSIGLRYSAAVGGILIGPAEQYVVPQGQGQPVLAVPNEGYAFAGWSDSRTDNPRTDIAVASQVSVQAQFVRDVASFELTYSAGIFGSISGQSTQLVEQGQSGSEVEAVPEAGATFMGWSDGLTAAKRTDSNVQANAHYRANFAKVLDLPYAQNFEAESLMPFAWGVDTKDGVSWGIRPLPVMNLEGSGNVATAVSDEHREQTTTMLLSPQFNLGNVNGDIIVSFDCAHRGNYSSKGTFMIKLDNGEWQERLKLPASTSTPAFAPFADTIRAADLAGHDTLTLGWKYSAHWQYFIAIDNVAISTEAMSGEVQLIYVAGEGGQVNGTTVVQTTTTVGTAGPAITATPNAGYRFVGWSDGRTDNPRTDTQGTMVYAQFEFDSGLLTYHSLAYRLDAPEHAKLLGGIVQPQVRQGADGAAVEVVPLAEGYRFVGWSDGRTNNPRTDRNVQADVDVSAQVSNLYTIRYSSANAAQGTIDGGATQQLAYGSTTAEVQAVPAVGYHFVGWSDGRTDNPRTDTVLADMSLEAIFDNVFTIGYSASEGGTLRGAVQQRIALGADASPVQALPYSGYRFVAWSDGSTDNPRTDSNVRADTLYVAQFETITYSLGYSSEAGGHLYGSALQQVQHGHDGAEVLAVPLAGYCFAAWSDGRTDNPRTDRAVVHSINVVAQFTSQVELRYLASVGGTVEGVSTQTIACGADAQPVEAVAAAGYHFVGWSDGRADNPRTDRNVRANIDVEALFANVWSVTYSAQPGGSIVGNAVQQVAHGNDAQSVNAVAAMGYAFVAWSDGRTDNPRTDAQVEADISVQAIFAPQMYSLSATTDLGVAWGGYGLPAFERPYAHIDNAEQTLPYGSNSLPVLVRPEPGVKFLRWSDGNTDNPRVFNITADATPKAVLEASKVHLYVEYSGEMGDRLGVMNGATGTELASGQVHEYDLFGLVVMNYTFNPQLEGRAVAVETNGLIQTDYHNTGVPNAIYYQVVAPLAYIKVTLVDINYGVFNLAYTAGAGGHVVGQTQQEVEYGHSGNAVEAVPAAGHHFVRWSDGCTDARRTDALVFGDIDVHAEFAPNVYTVRLSPNGASSEGIDLQLSYDQPDALPVAPFARRGYAFEGWGIAHSDTQPTYADGQSVLNLSAEHGAVVVLFALWSPNTYAVAFNPNGGQGTMDTMTMVYDAAQPLAANAFVREGHAFAGWATASDVVQPLYADRQPVHDLSAEHGGVVELFALWRPNTYAIAFDPNGGRGRMDIMTLEYDAAQPLAANAFVREGHAFAGWATAPDAEPLFFDGQSVLNLTAVADTQLVLYAIWVETVHELALQVFDESANPLSEARVTLGGKELITDAKGMVVDSLPMGRYAYTVELQGYAKLSGEVELASDTLLKVVLSRATGLRSVQPESLSTYPNPTTGELWIMMPELAEGIAAEVHVYSTSGQLLQRVTAHRTSAGSAASRLSIDLSGYPSGLYIVRVGNAVAKVVKR